MIIFMSKPTVTHTDLTTGFHTLGLNAGDTVFVHSSLSSFGYVKGGAKTVVHAFLDALTPQGTLAVPIFHCYFSDGPDQIWDRHNTPSLMGRITETVRTLPGAYRSAHAIHPIAAIGALAQDIADRDHETDFDQNSTFQRLIDHNAWIALLGVTYQNCTHIHVIEERLEIPYRYWTTYTGSVIDGDTRIQKTYRFLRRYPGVSNDFLPLGNALESTGKVHVHTIGNSTLRLFKARDLVDLGLDIVRQDPLFLVSTDTKKEAEKYLPPSKE